jgi:hypothetical protein
VLEVTYAGSKGNKLFVFLNGNQAAPSADPTAPLAPRRPVPLIDNGIDWFRSTGASSYNSLQLHYEKALRARTAIPGVLYLGALDRQCVEREPGAHTEQQ